MDSSAADTAVAVPRPRARDRADDGDGALVDACRRGEEWAMELLYHRYRRRVYGLANRIAGPDDADEVAQEAFVRILRGLPKFRGDAALGTWIYRLAVNAALTHVTRRPRHDGGDDVLDNLPAATTATRDPGLSARLERALLALPGGYRAVLVLHDIEGLSHEECASVLGCRVGTSKSQLHKARARMRELLGPELAAERRGHTRSRE